MSQTMRRLRQDHANLSRLLAALDRQVSAMERGETVDWGIIQRVVEYCLTHPDLHHHPLEDQLLARFQQRSPAGAAAYGGLAAEHRSLSASLRHVAAAVEQVLQDATVPRAWFIALVRRFLSEQHEHVGREESQFYPAAEGALNPVDWANLDRIAAALPPDPLFDMPTNRQYLTLLSDIKASEADEQRAAGPNPFRSGGRPDRIQ
jgi:hemerythrin-like domain-containing protein